MCWSETNKVRKMVYAATKELCVIRKHRERLEIRVHLTLDESIVTNFIKYRTGKCPRWRIRTVSDKPLNTSSIKETKKKNKNSRILSCVSWIYLWLAIHFCVAKSTLNTQIIIIIPMILRNGFWTSFFPTKHEYDIIIIIVLKREIDK